MAHNTPQGGTHEDCLHSLRPQGAHQFAGRNYPGLREAVLPMPERKVWAYLGIRIDFQTHSSAPSPALGYSPSRAYQELACGTATAVVATVGATHRSLIRKPRFAARDHDQPAAQVLHSATCRHHSRARRLNACCAGMRAACTISPDEHICWRGGTRAAAGGLTKPSPKIQAAPLRPARVCRRQDFDCTPARSITAFWPPGSPALGAGNPGMGAGHCPAAARARSPRPT